MPRYAAIDIGSNSVRTAVAEVEHGRGTKTLASDREVTRLGTSVFTQGVVSKEAMEHVCRTLKRYRALYEAHHAVGVRAVATSAVRDSRNQEEFLARASDAAGTTVEIVSGVEEARLIYNGVQSVWPQKKGRVLIIDIGGGSAETIIGENGQLAAAVSKPLGAVRMKELFLHDDPPSEQQLDELEAFIDGKVVEMLKRSNGGGFDRVIGTSATAAAVICAINGITRQEREAGDRLRATTAQVGRLAAELSRLPLAKRRKQVGIGPRRAEIIIGGITVLHHILRDFGARSIYYSVAGVRDGLIADLAARSDGANLSRLDKDQRRAVEAMARKFGVEIQHARKIAKIAGTLFDELKPVHGLPAASGKLLEAAAYLVDVGHYVSDMGHHKHSQYLVANADIPAFTAEERGIIAQLCRFHRKSMPSARHTFFQSLPAATQKMIVSLVPLLRLADGLDWSHDQRVDEVEVELQGPKIVISLESAADTNLELWAGQRAADIFQQVYGKELILRLRRPRGGLARASG